MAKDLRAFIHEIATTMPDEIQLVTEEVDPRFGVTALAGKLAQQQRFPALYFTRMKGSDLPLVINLTASYERLALALGTTVAEMATAYGERQAKPIPPQVVRDGPVREMILTGERAKLSLLPIPTHNELDSGAYITGGVLICKDPDTGLHNSGMYRHEVQAERQLGVYFQGSHHGGAIYKRYAKKNRPMEVAIAIGHYPTFMLGAVSRLPGLGGEFEEAGALLGEPLELVKAETVDLMVPARAEIVIEGEMPPRETHFEGPFGEWPGYYVAEGEQPFIKVKAITMRKDAIYYNVFPASQEHLVLGSLPRMGSIYRRVKESVPGVVNVNVPAHARTHCYVSIKKSSEADSKEAAMAALKTEPENLRFVVVVDEDVDVFNESQVMWAVGTRFRAEKDLTVIPNFSGPGGLNPSNWEYGVDESRKPVMGSAMILDATMPAPPLRFPPRTKPPEELVSRVEPERLLKRFDPKLVKS
ncbi:MAG: 4-hydroxybenzoate decarboxylase [Deltaproteobacteria bacterium RIFCSPLOWO2_12_FULL_60_19]|nr:MAG: 4-hydroxybenzoate decarboxylase [Deltaproteobacteria bacterium RIFCSPLOWO2_12_FULL_60_19]